MAKSAYIAQSLVIVFFKGGIFCMDVSAIEYLVEDLAAVQT